MYRNHVPTSSDYPSNVRCHFWSYRIIRKSVLLRSNLQTWWVDLCRILYYCWWFRNPKANHPWNPVNNGINYQPQLVKAGFLNHQQYSRQITILHQDFPEIWPFPFQNASFWGPPGRVMSLSYSYKSTWPQMHQAKVGISTPLSPSNQ